MKIMSKQFIIIFLALTVVGVAAATNTTAGEDKGGGEQVIGSVTSGPATDAAPVGGPVPENVFPKVAPAPGPASTAPVLEVTAIAAAAVVTSFLF
ncbi:hypothetical protein ACS0TY_036162 [Phlomoides rotata]